MYAPRALGSLRTGRVAWAMLACPVIACGTDEVVFVAGATASDARDAQAPSFADPDQGAKAAPDDLPDAGLASDDDAAAPEENHDAEAPALPTDAVADAAEVGCSEQVNPPYAPACTVVPLVPSRTAASASLVGQSAKNAFDGDTCSSWRAGATPPQWVEVELCTGARCAALPRFNRVGVYMEREPSSSMTIELQGATAAGRATNAFHTMASATIMAASGYAEIAVAAETQPVMRVLVNSGAPAPVVLREVVFLQCP